MKPGMVSLPVPSKPGVHILGHDIPANVRNSQEKQHNNLALSSGRRDEQLDDAVRTLLNMFPQICPKEATSSLQLLTNIQGIDAALHLAVDHFLQRESTNTNRASTSALKVENGERREVVDLSSSGPDSDAGEYATGDALYQEWCMFRLSVDFPRVALPSLKNALKVFEGKLGPAYKAVNLQYQRAAKKKGVQCENGIRVDDASEDVSWLPRGRLKLLKFDRPPKTAPINNSPLFEKELEALQLKFEPLEGQDCHQDVEKPRDDVVECGCCCSENPFEELVQCADGHLFCMECLRRHLEAYIFGVSQTCGLPTCMDTDGCDKTFPWSEVKRALPIEVLSKYEQRQAEDAVARAKLEGLVYCPFCNHPWEVDRGMVVLNCLSENCRKSSCIKCKEPNHHPLRCEEVEKKSETSLRRKVEELMTKALIRECSSCKAELVKTDGCNKITCRCGQIMCYVCRKPIMDYSHFCQHVREPGQRCVICAGCSLWERENEAEVVKAAKQAAIEEVGAHEPGLLKREIGPSEEGKHHKRPRKAIV